MTSTLSQTAAAAFSDQQLIWHYDKSFAAVGPLWQDSSYWQFKRQLFSTDWPRCIMIVRLFWP